MTTVLEICVKLICHDGRPRRSISTRRQPVEGRSEFATLLAALTDMRPAIDIGLGDDAAEIEVTCRPVRVKLWKEPVK